jgi:hypothetical protein
MGKVLATLYQLLVQYTTQNSSHEIPFGGLIDVGIYRSLRVLCHVRKVSVKIRLCFYHSVDRHRTMLPHIVVALIATPSTNDVLRSLQDQQLEHVVVVAFGTIGSRGQHFVVLFEYVGCF